MSNPYRLVVFDWEGTLGDILGPFLNAIAIQAKQLGLGAIDVDAARYYSVLGPVVAVKKIFPHLSSSQQVDLLQKAQHAMLLASPEVCLTPDAREILRQIKQAGLQLAIATNRGQQSLLRDLEIAGLLDMFDVTRSASQAPAKPCPQMIEEIMDECCVSPQETLMVGDSVSDIEMAVQARVTAIGVDFYGQNESALRVAGAYDVFDSFQQLSKFLGLS